MLIIVWALPGRCHAFASLSVRQKGTATLPSRRLKTMHAKRCSSLINVLRFGMQPSGEQK